MTVVRRLSALLVLGSLGIVSATTTPGPPRLFKDSRQSLAIARAQGKSLIGLVVAARDGRTEAAAADARRFGADIRYQDDEIGYLRVGMPLNSTTAFSESPNVEAIAADWDATQPTRLFSAQDGDTALSTPYSPLASIDAAAWLAANPTYDGRGVTIAVFDATPDLLLPELQTAYTVDGRRVPKIAGVINVTDPRDAAAEVPQWVNMAEEVRTTGSQLEWREQTYTAPYDGLFRIGLFDERRFDQISGATFTRLDVDFSGNGPDDDGLFGVLWDENSGDVWVDTNRNHAFEDETRLADYRVRPQIGRFGIDDPSTVVRESIGFAVQTDTIHKFISVNIGIYEHGTLILGAMTANPEPSGRLTGIAPGARIVSMSHGSSMHAAIEGLSQAFRDPAIDLIVFESHSGMMAYSYVLSDGRHPFSLLMQRLTDRFHKLMFVPGGNRPAFGLVAEDGAAPGVVSVGAYQSRESYRAHWGISLAESDHLHYAGLSHGPSGSGALKPDLLGPTGLMSTQVGFKSGAERKGVYQLPPGYTVAGGTSTATPMAAGAAALVISGARQRGIRWNAQSLKSSLMNSARFIPRLAAHEQGAGLVQVGRAFELLRTAKGTAPIQIRARAPVRTALSGLLSPPHEGVGLYEREGWSAGQRGERTVTFTRTSGSSAPMTFTVRWLGNDGTFSSPRSIVLPLNQSVTLPVVIEARSHGAHSATLLLEHPIEGTVARVLCTIIAALPLDARTGYTNSTTVAVPRASDRSVFVNVPPNAAALTFSAESSSRPVRLTLVSPSRQNLLPCRGPTAADREAENATACAIAKPLPGVWEINLWDGDLRLDESDKSAAPDKQVTVTAAVLAVDITLSSVADLRSTVHNRGAALEAAATATSHLGSAYRTKRWIGAGEQHLYRVVVPDGATLLKAAVRAASARDDLDIYLIDCSHRMSEAREPDRSNRVRSRAEAEPPCTPVAKASDLGASGEVEVIDPEPGEWAVVIDAFALRGERASYEYVDAFTHPMFGEIVTDHRQYRRAVGATWNAVGKLHVAHRPEAPRELYARLTVTSPDAQEALTDWSGQRLWVLPLGSHDLFLDAPH